MATQGVRVVQRIEIASQASNINAISWSADNRLAVVVNGCVTIIGIKGVDKKEKEKVSKLKITRNFIPAETKVKEYDVELEFSEIGAPLPLFSESPCHSTLTIDPALSPYILKNYGTQDVTYAKWSPVGCDKIGRSVLAVLFRTNKLALFVKQNVSSMWKEIANLTESHHTQLTKEHYFVDNEIMKGKLPPDARTAVGNKKTWHSFQEWQHRKFLLHFTCIEWCPSTVICLNHVKNTSSKFVFLATMVKSGQLFLWKGKVPLTDTQTALNRMLATHMSMFYPCSLAWSAVTATGATYLACGNSEGLLKVLYIKISSNRQGVPVIVIEKAYIFVGSRDDRSVDCLAWHAKEDKLFLVCSKGPHISVFQTQVMKEGTLSKATEQIVTGTHLLNVTALAISSYGTLFSTSAEGTVQQFKLGTGQRTSVLPCDTPSFGCVGVAVSPNGVFITLLQNKRQLMERKPVFANTGSCQITFVSVITEEENDNLLASWKSRPTDIRQLWDRFFFREMCAQGLTDATNFPETFNGLSQSQLQFIRNTIAVMPTRERASKSQKVKQVETIDGDQLNEVAVPSGVEAGFENRDPSQDSLDVIDKIEEAIAGLIMQKVLMAFLRVREKSDVNSGIFVGEPLIWNICHWLAQKIPTQAVMNLLEKTWRVCNPSLAPAKTNDEMAVDEMAVDEMAVNPSSSRQDLSNSPSVPEATEHARNVCDEILKSDKSLEKCMCGQPIMLQEPRSGRCAAGHVWPRCCVTFKLLEGANCRACENCNAHALIQNPADGSPTDWTKNLLAENVSCTYCGGWFEYVC